MNKKPEKDVNLKNIEKNFPTDYLKEKNERKDEHLSEPEVSEELAVNDEQEASQPESEQTTQIPDQ